MLHTDAPKPEPHQIRRWYAEEWQYRVWDAAKVERSPPLRDATFRSNEIQHNTLKYFIRCDVRLEAVHTRDHVEECSRGAF
jgi:hypothetical protein